jgi:hypothetical protein
MGLPLATRYIEGVDDVGYFRLGRVSRQFQQSVIVVGFGENGGLDTRHQ